MRKSTISRWPFILPSATLPILLAVGDGLANKASISLLALVGTVVISIGLSLAGVFANEVHAGISSLSGDFSKNAKDLKRVNNFYTLLVFLTITIVSLFAFLIVPAGMTLLWMLGAAAVVAALSYSGAGIAYGKRGGAPAIFFFFFGPVALLGSGALAAHFISLNGILFGLACGAMAMAVLTLLHAEDYKDNNKGNSWISRIFFGGLIAAATFTAMAAASKPWLWGTTLILLIWGARLNAAVSAAKDDLSLRKLLPQALALQGVWALAVFLGIMI